jgi:hypothetical protein
VGVVTRNAHSYRHVLRSWRRFVRNIESVDRVHDDEGHVRSACARSSRKKYNKFLATVPRDQVCRAQRDAQQSLGE